LVDTPPYGPTTPNLPIDNLHQFLEELEKLLDNIVNYWDQILFAEEFRQPLKEAWSETRQRIPQLRDELNAQDPRLEQVGLREGQSQHGLKMRVLNALWDRFFSRPTIGGLRGLLGWIDQMLSSLAR
jgi:hypothetical protein